MSATLVCLSMANGSGVPNEGADAVAFMMDASLAFVKSMAIKAVVKLGIPDIIASRGGSDAILSLDEIATQVGAKNNDFLFRVMRYLVHQNVFVEKEGKYGLTPASRCLVTKEPLSQAPLVEWVLHETFLTPFHHFADCILEGDKVAFVKSHGKTLAEFARQEPRLGQLLGNAMVASSKEAFESVIMKYNFEGIQTLVDAGGGFGYTVSRIVAAHPNIKGINFDLPHVVARGPSLPGVEHVGGDIFKCIPAADAILMKQVLHLWDDDKCVEILRRCYDALPENGKVILVEAVIGADTPSFSSFSLVQDMVMLGLTGGRERNEAEWHSLLQAGGFLRIKMHDYGALYKLIEGAK